MDNNPLPDQEGDLDDSWEAPAVCPYCGTVGSVYWQPVFAPEYMSQEEAERFEAESEPKLTCHHCGPLLE